MNIIYMHTHDTGRYIQPYGHNIPTPNLMQLAQEGTLFRNAYCAGPTCSPSRAGMLTGMAAHSCGMIGLAHRGFELNDYGMHLVQFLNGYQYETVLCGVQHEATNGEIIGYKNILNQTKNAENKALGDIDNAIRVAEYIKNKQDGAFFLSFGMYNTHRVFPKIDSDTNPNYIMPPYPLLDTKENREDMAGFVTSAKIMDRSVGIVLEALKESGHEQDTMVIFTTDHGIAFPKMKCTLYDTGIGVSFIVKYPENVMKGKAVDALISQIDLFPTICDILNLEKPNWLQGISMLPILEGKVDKIRDEIFSEVNYHVAYEPMRCIRTNRYKLIRFYEEYEHYAFCNIDNSISKSFLLDEGFMEEKREKQMLFDLYLDPLERVNLTDSIKYSHILQNLDDRLSIWMEKTFDPLLNGKVDKPEGALCNEPSCISPNS